MIGEAATHFWMLIAMIAVGIGFRIYEYLFFRRRGQGGPPWWKWM